MSEISREVPPKPDFSPLPAAQMAKTKIFVDRIVEENSKESLSKMRELIRISIDGHFADSPQVELFNSFAEEYFESEFLQQDGVFIKASAIKRKERPEV